MVSRHRLLVGLLVDGPVAVEIDGIRRALSSSQLERIAPHITLISPTNVANDALDDAERVVREEAGRIGAIELSLGPPATFVDNASVLFLKVVSDMPLAHVREGLLSGPFVARDRRDRPFVPHLTLDSRQQPFVDDRMLADLAGYTASVRISSLSLLVQDELSPLHRWRTLTSYDLAPVSIVGRGGREIHLQAGAGLSATTRALMASWGSGTATTEGEGRGERFALAFISSEVVAVATWWPEGDVAALAEHVVAPSWRGLGVGTSLLSFVEEVERSRGSRAIVLASAIDDAGDAFYLSRGYRRDLRLGRLGVPEFAPTRML